MTNEAAGPPADVLVDTNVLVRHLTGDPPAQARRATALLRDAERLEVTDLVLAEVVWVLESFYGQPHDVVATAARAIIAFPSVHVSDEQRLLRSIELYADHRIDFADAYLAATAEMVDSPIASFDRDLDAIATVIRHAP